MNRTILFPIALLVGSLAGWFFVAQPPPKPPPVPHLPSIELSKIRAFHDDVLRPLIEENKGADLAAADRCLLRIEEAFARYRAGVKPFSEDITRMGTRVGMLRRMFSDWWTKGESVQPFVHAKFQRHIFGEKELTDDVTAALLANQRQLLASVKLAVTEHDFPELILPDTRVFDEEARRVLLAFASERAESSVYHGVVTLLVGEVVFGSVAHIIARTVAVMGTSAGASAVAATGATASSAAAGASGGTFAGPVGTALGLGVGLVVGVLIDAWMTENFREKLEADVNTYLNELHSGLVEGLGGEPGLREVLRVVCEEHYEVHGATFRRGLWEGFP